MEEENNKEASVGAREADGKDSGERDDALAKMARTFDVRVSNKEILRSWQRSLEITRRGMRMQGYRPGKVPMEIVRARYGEEYLRDIVFDKLREGVEAAPECRGWELPIVKSVNKGLADGWEKDPEGESVLNVTCQPSHVITFLTPEEEISLPKCELVEADDLVERTIQKLVGQYKEHTEAPEGAELVMGDLANITSRCEIDGEVYNPGTLEEANIEIGDREFLGAASKLVGMKAGETRKFETEIDLNASEVHLSDTPEGVERPGMASFEVTLNHILNSEEVEIDDNFVKRLDPEANHATFVEEVGKNVKREIERRMYLFDMSRLILLIMKSVRVEFDTDHFNQEYHNHLYSMWNSGDNRKKYKTLEKFIENFHNEKYHEWFLHNALLGVVFDRLNKINDIKVLDSEIVEFVDRVAETYDDPQTYKRTAIKSASFLRDAERVLKFRKLLDVYKGRSSELKYMTVTSLYNFFRTPEASVLDYYRIY